MIISRTPFRVSFFGGGTDYPGWYREHGGAVLATSINKYCYLTCRYLPPFFEHRLRVVYSKIEMCRKVEEIGHPAVRETLRYLGIERGLEIHHDGDLPARSGMGSSSAFTVGLLHALHGLSGKLMSKEDLAAQAIHVEQELLQETVGSQDQVLAAHGGFNFVEFRTDGGIRVNPLPVGTARLEALNEHLMLFYTGLRRTASEVAATYVKSIGSKSRQLEQLRGMVDEGIKILTGRGPLDAFGQLLHEAWCQKRSLSGVVSNSDVDEIYGGARAAGALGGKLLGAGGGGFMLFYIHPQRRAALRERLKDLIWVPFQFDTGGSQIIFFAPEPDYADLDRQRDQSPARAFRESETPK